MLIGNLKLSPKINQLCLARVMLTLGFSASLSARAFDPFTTLSAAGSMTSIMNKADEAATVGFALTDLLEELGQDSTEEEKTIQNSLDKLENLQSQTRELEYLSSDINQSLEYDLKRGNNITRKLKALKNTIAASKKIATIMGLRPKAAEGAAHIRRRCGQRPANAPQGVVSTSIACKLPEIQVQAACHVRQDFQVEQRQEEGCTTCAEHQQKP